MKDLGDLEKVLSPDELQELAPMLQRLQLLEGREQKQKDFMSFVKHVWPNFIEGQHHKIYAEKLQAVAEGRLKRLIINMPPRHTKSEYASYLFPAWLMGRDPTKKIIQATHTAELAVGFGRKVKGLIESEEFREVFPDVKLAADAKASGRWSTNKRGEYYAVGVGGALAGRGADLAIIDDPISEQMALSPSELDKVYEWYTSGPRQRLQPGGAIIIVMCMVGSTEVLMADGSVKKLKEICKGDMVATYESGSLSVSRVLNHQSNGFDDVFTVKTRSGKMLTANRDHPFLVDHGGVRKWAKLRDLAPGMFLVGLTDVSGQQGLKKIQDYAPRANQKNITTERTPVGRAGRLVTMGSGRAKCARVENPYIVRACANLAIPLSTRSPHQLLSSAAPDALNRDMGLLSNNIRTWWLPVATAATYAENSLPLKTLVHIGMASCVSTIATILERCVDFCATTATSLLDTAKRLKPSLRLRNTYKICPDEIIEICASGCEEVFDIQVDRTENFIANGVVSHNTRWSIRDLTAKVLAKQADKGADKWEVVEFPAILPSGKPLWPEYWSLEELEAVKASIPLGKWNAQYMQNPTAEEGAIIKREWWQRWEKSSPPPCDYVIQSYDTAFSTSERADMSAISTWGIFSPNEDDVGIILLDAVRGRWEFPELKAQARQLYEIYQPDMVLIEQKASGAPLTQELRRMGIPVTPFTPSRGADKMTRMNACAPVFESELVWAPEAPFADEMIEECAAFPNGEFDDLADTMTQAILRFRQGGFVMAPSDYRDDDDMEYHRRRREYY